MKTAIIIVLLFIVGGISTAVYLSGNSSMTEVSVLHDVTDTFLSQPKASEITTLFALDQNKWNGGQFRFTDITDVSYMPAKEANIGSSNQWLSNQYDRTNEIKKFNTDVSKIMSDSQNIIVGRRHSSIYLPIAMELNRMSQDRNDVRILLVYSDLMENDPNLSLYDRTTFNQLFTDFEASEKKFKSLLPISNLTGIEVHLLFQPKDAISDGQYKIVSEFYKKLLQSKGARVIISANLN